MAADIDTKDEIKEALKKFLSASRKLSEQDFSDSPVSSPVSRVITIGSAAGSR